MFDDDNEYEDLLPGSKRHRSISSQLDELEATDFALSMQGDTTFLPSSMGKKKKATEEDKKADEWFDELISQDSLSIKKGSKKASSINKLFEEDYGKKKKKKKKKAEGELTDFKKEFEPETMLYRTLLRDQNRFTDSLQREYDAMTSRKSSARGTNKVVNELVENITSARALSMQLVEKSANTKKLIAELSMKERKEKGGMLGDSDNMSDFASTYLKNLIAERQNVIGTGDGSADISDYTDDDIDDAFAEGLAGSTRAEEVNTYLKYENSDIVIYARINENDFSDYEFEAIDNDTNEVVDDYPLPYKTSLSVNKSTGQATDEYGQKFPIIWT